MTIPIALTIAGSDSSGGAGIQADLKTFAALGVYGASVITALTAQNTTGVRGIHRGAGRFRDRANRRGVQRSRRQGRQDRHGGAARDHRGHRRGSGALVAEACRARSRDGGDIGRSSAGDATRSRSLRTELIPRASLITPNLPEAAALLDEPVAASEAAIESQGQRLLAMGCRAVLIKGGHGQGGESIDYLFGGDGTIALAAPRIATKNTHGTGCSLSSAIAAGLAKGEDLETAVRMAKAWISAAIAAADRLGVGHGHGPIHHFHRFY